MATRDAYLFYEAGQAVAAAHLGLKIRHISGNPASAPTDIIIPRREPKARMILWLTGMAAEKKAVGRGDPLRRTRNRARVRAQIEYAKATMVGPGKRMSDVRNILNQAQDRANAICSDLYEAIENVVARLRASDLVPGEEVVGIVRAVKEKRAAAGQTTIEEATLPAQDTTALETPSGDQTGDAPVPETGPTPM